MPELGSSGSVGGVVRPLGRAALSRNRPAYTFSVDQFQPPSGPRLPGPSSESEGWRRWRPWSISYGDYPAMQRPSDETVAAILSFRSHGDDLEAAHPLELPDLARRQRQLVREGRGGDP